LLHLAILHGARLQLGPERIGHHLRDRLREQAGNALRRHGKIDRIERDRADRVVGAVIVARLVDRQQLQQTELVFGRKGDGVAHRLRVPDAQVLVVAQRENRNQCSGQTRIC
jgi:hypothetical protein